MLTPVLDNEFRLLVAGGTTAGRKHLHRTGSTSPECSGRRWLFDTGSMATEPTRSATYFDAWYAGMVGSAIKDEVQQRHLGLPPDLLSTSLLTWGGIGEVTQTLQLAVGDTLLDLACGRGGYGLEIATRTGADLIGVDLSAEAIRQAAKLAQRRSQAADFRVGDLTATGLQTNSIDAVLCIDAIQFASPSAAAYQEMRRVLKPGGRATLTCWEPIDRNVDGLPDRLRVVDLQAGLEGAGFQDVEVAERPNWRTAERAMWQEAVTLDAGEDPALHSFRDEGVRSLLTFTLLRRVLATATAPTA